MSVHNLPGPSSPSDFHPLSDLETTILPLLRGLKFNFFELTITALMKIANEYGTVKPETALMKNANGEYGTVN